MKASSFIMTTLIAAAAMTSTAWAEEAVTTTLSVDSSCTESSDTVFKTVNEAMVKAQTIGGATIDLGEEDTPDSMGNLSDNTAIWRTNGTYTFTGGNFADLATWVQTPKPSEATGVDIDIVFEDAKVIAGKFRLDKGSSLTIENSHMDARGYSIDNRAWTTFYGDATINITNSVVGYHIDNYNDNGNSSAIVAGDKTTDYSAVSGGMVFNGSGVMTVTDSTLFGYSNAGDGAVYGVYDKGLFTFTNSAIYGGSLAVGISNDSKTVGRDGKVATMIFDNSTFRYINGDFIGTYGRKITVGSEEAGHLIIRNNSVVDYTATNAGAMIVNSNGVVDVDNSTLKVNTLTNRGNISVNGGTLNVGTLSGGNSGQLFVYGQNSVITGTSFTGELKLRIGQADTNNDGVADSSAPTGNTLTLGVDSMIVNFANINNTDVTLSKDTSITTTGKYADGEWVNFSYISSRYSNYDLAGHELTVGGGFMLTGATFRNGTVVFNGDEGPTHTNIVFQDSGSTIAADASLCVMSGVVSIYEDLTVNGAFVDTRTSGNQINVGLTSSAFGAAADYTDGANLVVTGDGASFTTGVGMNVYGADAEKGIDASSVTISDGATMTIGGVLKNDSTITVGEGSTLTANVITGDGDVVLAGTITVVEGLSADVLTIHAGATLNVGDATEGVMLLTAVVDSVITANEIVLVVDDTIVEGGSLDLETLQISGTGADDLLAALSADNAVVYVQDGDGLTYSTTFNSETGKITIGEPVPEPSAFGLLAGLGALALVAARRRRR